jgi:two-component system, OmpR family, sensor histidine kinase KdpD
MTREERAALARTAGLRDFDTPALEDVDRRRSQLWLLSLLVGLTIPVVIVVLGFESLSRTLAELVDVRTVRLVLLAFLVVLFGYVAERERVLRNLSKLLVEERVLTATLVSRIQELDALLEASRAMNSNLNLTNVLDVILRSACDLLGAREGSIQLSSEAEAGVLVVAAVQGESSAQLGQRQLVGEGLAGGVAERREALLVSGPQHGSGCDREVRSALVAPLVHRGELVGVLNVAGPSAADFNEFQLRSVAVFAETAAAAIAHARVHERSAEQIATLTELDQMKDEFLQLVTHELRTPLTSLIGLSSTMASGAERLRTDQVRQLAEMIRGQGWRLEQLVNDLLQSAAAQHGILRLSLAVEDVGAVVADAVAVFRSGAPDHDIQLSVPDAPLERTVDSNAVSRILANLLGNAVKYAPSGTTVHVALSPHESGGVAITVADEGPGISPEERELLFAKFRRSPMVAHTNGLGLGLYIVRSLAEAHGGEASVRESASGGSEFVVVLADLSGELETATSGAHSGRAS